MQITQSRRVSKSQFFLVFLALTIPYSSIHLFGNPFLFLPMVMFIIYFALRAKDYAGLFDLKGTRMLVFPLLLLWLSILISSILNYMPEHFNYNRSILQRLLIYGTFFLVLFNEMRKSYELQRLVRNSIILSVLVMGVLFVSGLGVSYPSNRLSILGANPNLIGLWAVLGIMFSLDLIVRRYKNKKQLYVLIPVIIMAFVLMISTGSRKSIIMLAAGVSVYYLFLNRNLAFKLKVLIPTVMLGFLGFNFMIEDPLFMERYQSEIERQTLGGRLSIWEASISLIRESPLIGLSPGLHFHEMHRLIGRASPHNEFISIAAYSGLIGLSFILMFFITLGKRSISVLKKKDEEFTTLPLALLVVVIAFFASAGGALNSFSTWFIFAFIAALTEKQQLIPHRKKYFISLPDNNEDFIRN